MGFWKQFKGLKVQITMNSLMDSFVRGEILKHNIRQHAQIILSSFWHIVKLYIS